MKLVFSFTLKQVLRYGLLMAVAIVYMDGRIVNDDFAINAQDQNIFIRYFVVG